MDDMRQTAEKDAFCAHKQAPGYLLWHVTEEQIVTLMKSITKSNPKRELRMVPNFRHNLELPKRVELIRRAVTELQRDSWQAPSDIKEFT